MLGKNLRFFAVHPGRSRERSPLFPEWPKSFRVIVYQERGGGEPLFSFCYKKVPKVSRPRPVAFFLRPAILIYDVSRDGRGRRRSGRWASASMGKSAVATPISRRGCPSLPK